MTIAYACILFMGLLPYVAAGIAKKDDQVACWKELAAVCRKYGVVGVVDDKYSVEPEFHDERHVLIPEVNRAIDEILPLQVHITT